MSTASFVRAMRTLLWHPSRHTFLAEEVESPAVASGAKQEDSSEV